MKQYNGEKAIISLTSWKARINTVCKTLFSLIDQCPGFHIVLVLSEEEFPKKENELPENLKIFIDNDLIEVLWVYKNYKSFKKVLFTMDKYRDVPVISADDDCIYTCNYAQELYDKWKVDPNTIISESLFVNYKDLKIYGGGWGVIYPPKLLSKCNINIYDIDFDTLSGSNDDLFYSILAKLNSIAVKSVGHRRISEIAIHPEEDLNSLSRTGQHNENKQYYEYYNFIKSRICGRSALTCPSTEEKISLI